MERGNVNILFDGGVGRNVTSTLRARVAENYLLALGLRRGCTSSYSQSLGRAMKKGDPLQGLLTHQARSGNALLRLSAGFNQLWFADDSQKDEFN